MTEDDFRGLYRELIDENPLAIRAVLQVLGIEFTEKVSTLAVTCTKRPVLKVNLRFLEANCETEAHVKAVILHEFLHILLRHTQSAEPCTPERHLATDAVINAIIHRQVGPDYSGMMSGYYRDEGGIGALLRPPSEAETRSLRLARVQKRASTLEAAWYGLYEGSLCADDIEEIAKDLPSETEDLGDGLLGGHKPEDGVEDPSAGKGPLPAVLEQALDRSLGAMNGGGIWRSPHGRGVGTSAYQREVLQSSERVDAWCRATFEVLKRHVDRSVSGGLSEPRPVDYMLPVLSSRDRRAGLRALWSPFLPEARWQGERIEPVGSAQIYLDVSGSMNAEMPLIVGLLARLGRYIQRPFWAFSNHVAPAVIENGLLVADTTGGTSMSCVLEHLASTRPATAVVVTDGYIETLPRRLVRSARDTRLHAIVTRDGSPKLLQEAQIPFTQLGRVPQ